MALTFTPPTGGVNFRRPQSPISLPPRPSPGGGTPVPIGMPSPTGQPDYAGSQVPQQAQRLSEQAALDALRGQTAQQRFKDEVRAARNRRSDIRFQDTRNQRLQQTQQGIDDRNANEAFQREVAMMRIRAQMANDARMQALEVFRNFLGRGGGGGGGGVDAEAEAATYGRAKDAIAGQQEGALKALSAQMARRGISGSGIEADSLGGIVTAGQGALGEVSRGQAIERQRRQQQVEDRDLAILANLFSSAGRVF